MLQASRQRLEAADELAIVSTCNRTELYVGSARADSGKLAEHAVQWLAESGGMAAPELRGHVYVLEDERAARHAFRLASGLNSMVVGETQILSQMKQAVREADTVGTLGTTLHQLFQRSFAVAKEVRTDTEIGMHSISMAAAIVRQAGQIFEDFSELRVLMVGAGEMALPVLTHVHSRSPRSLTIANRSLERGAALAERFGADPIGLAEIAEHLHRFDLVISCTASPQPLIGRGMVAEAIKARRRRPMMMFDLAVPRDIEPGVGELPDVYLYTIDDLSHVVQEGKDKRLAAVGQAESIIETGVQDFVRWLDTRDTVPVIQALQAQAESWRAAEVLRARKLLARGEDVQAVLEALSRGITQKMLHGPMAGLNALEGDERSELSETLTQLFLRCPQRGRR
jgi:glutamyl-tRNA reductase